MISIVVADACEKDAARPGALRGRLWVKLLVATLVPVALILAGIGYLAHRAVRVSMEGQLGEELVALARIAADQVGKPRALRLRPGDRDSRTYANLRDKLHALQRASGVESIYLFDREGRALVDSRGRFAIAEPIVKLAADQAEIEEVHAGRARASVLFTGADGALYKTGFAPVRIDTEVVAAVGVDGSAGFFEPLDRLRRTLVVVSLVALALVALVTLAVARGITRPLDRLVQSARAIGRGELDGVVEVETRDEIGVLAGTLNEARKSIQERDQQLQMMLSGIAHEVRNPLGGMALFAGLLREELAGNPTGLKYVKRIETELDYLSRVVSDFLAYARERPLEIEEIDPRQEIEEIAALAAADCERAGVELVTEVDDGLERVHWDRERMRRALLNLVRNAVQASASGSSVRLAMSRSADGLVVEVADRGCGIAADKQARVFESFYTTRQQGTGLGLALVRKVVEAHGGGIRLHSVAQQGTTFTIRLPEGEELACPPS